MIPYHGTPLGGKRAEGPAFFRNRHALVPWISPEDIGIVAETCRSFCLDNGAFSAWNSGKPIADWSGYYEWVHEWMHHPGFDFAIIPDVIDGDEKANNELLRAWPWGPWIGCPVWHMHESIERLRWMTAAYPRVAIGSSGQWPTPGRPGWIARMDKAMKAICVGGRPPCKLHGLRMLNPAIFYRLPLSSADSTNAAQNASRQAAEWNCSVSGARSLIADRPESHNSAGRWKPVQKTKDLFMGIEDEVLV